MACHDVQLYHVIVIIVIMLSELQVPEEVWLENFRWTNSCPASTGYAVASCSRKPFRPWRPTHSRQQSSIRWILGLKIRARQPEHETSSFCVMRGCMKHVYTSRAHVEALSVAFQLLPLR